MGVRSVLGIVGGSGFYNLPGLEKAEWRRLSSPWGEPSDDGDVHPEPGEELGLFQTDETSADHDKRIG